MPTLNQSTLKNLQEYVADLEVERGFNNDSLTQKCLLLGEEIGELFKAIRKSEGIKIDKNSQVTEIADELADIFIYLCAIANRLDIDLETAFLAKEEVNKKRTWET